MKTSISLISSIAVLCASSVVRANGPVPLKIAVLQPFGRPDDSWNWSYAAGFQMIQLAFEDAKTILPMADFQAIQYDSYSGLEDESTDAATSVFKVLDAIKDGVVAVIGDATSDASMQSSLLTGNFKIPQCSFSSGSPYLSKKATYPYFFRTIGSSANDATKSMEFIQFQNWSQIGIVYSDNAIGRGAIEQANIDAKRLGIKVKTIFSIPFGTPVNDSSFQNAMTILQENDVRIILMLGTTEEMASFYITTRLYNKFIGPDYLFITNNDYYYEIDDYLMEVRADNYTVDETINWMWNTFYVGSSDGGSDAPWYQMYEDKWAAANFTKYPYVDPGFNTWNRIQAYTCAWMIVHGFKSLVDELGGDEVGVLTNISHHLMGDYLKPSRFSKSKFHLVLCIDVLGRYRENVTTWSHGIG